MFGEFNIQNYRIYIVDNSGGEAVVYTREKPEEVFVERIWINRVRLELANKERITSLLLSIFDILDAPLGTSYVLPNLNVAQSSLITEIRGVVKLDILKS